MQNFNFSFPTKIRFGKNTHLETGKLVSGYGKKIMILFGSDRIRKSGLLEEIENILIEEGIQFIEFGGVTTNPSVELVRRGIEICKNDGIEFILAVGGGSVIDSAKAIAIGTLENRDIWNIICDSGKTPDLALPIGTIVTLPASGSEANGVTVISNHDSNEKKSIYCSACVPKFSILNPELTLTLSQYDTAIASMDIFSHCFERYFDLRRQGELWDRMTEATMRSVLDISNKLVDNPTDYQLRSEIMWAATVAHSNMLGPGGDFACHRLAHALTVQYQIPHGMAVSLLMIAWGKYMYVLDRQRFDTFAQNVWGVESGVEGIRKMEIHMANLGLPVKLKEIVKKEICTEELVEIAFSTGEKTLGEGFRKISRTEANQIFRNL